VLGRGIERAIRHRQKAEHGADVDDATASLASHMWHDGTRHSDEPEKVRFEDRPGLIERALFGSGRGNTEARVVHKQIDVTVSPHHFADRSLHGFVAGHVEGQHLERSFACLGAASAGAVDLVASVREPLRRGFADA